MPSVPAARWSLPDEPSLELLRKRAKRLRREVAAGDPAATGLVATYDPPYAGGPVPLARAQRVLARAHGFAGWSRLREHLATIEALARPMAATDDGDDAVDAFLRAAVLSYSDPASTGLAGTGAVALLEADPSLATASVWTLAACGRAGALADRLDRDPALVAAEGGPHRWVPLLYLCYSRVPQQDAVGTLRTLLAHGADPDAGFLWRGLASPYTALTGVLGGGERDEPPHPDATALAELLLDAGADPNDNQAFYDRAFGPDDSHLGPLLAHGAGRDRPSPWRARLGSAYPTAEEMLGEHLRSAAQRGFTARVRTLLAAGVDPDTRGYHPALGEATAYEVALTHGQTETADLLAAAGARTDAVGPDDLAVARALAGEPGPAVPGLPDRRPDAVRLAGELHGVPALEALVALGYDVSQQGRWSTTALHEAALRGDADQCRWLVDRGADRGVRDDRFGATPSGWARHAGHDDLADELDP